MQRFLSVRFLLRSLLNALNLHRRRFYATNERPGPLPRNIMSDPLGPFGTPPRDAWVPLQAVDPFTFPQRASGASNYDSPKLHPAAGYL